MHVLALQDVGLSKILVNESTMMTSFQGTFEWAPPELINGGECSEKADIYSFGVILWEIVTAERPYRKQFRAARYIPGLLCGPCLGRNHRFACMKCCAQYAHSSR